MQASISTTLEVLAEIKYEEKTKEKEEVGVGEEGQAEGEYRKRKKRMTLVAEEEELKEKEKEKERSSWRRRGGGEDVGYEERGQRFESTKENVGHHSISKARMDGWIMDGWMNGWKDRRTDKPFLGRSG